jgi:hypothetical protein
MYSSPNIITKSRRISWAGCVSLIRVNMNVYRGFGGEVRRKETARKA